MRSTKGSARRWRRPRGPGRSARRSFRLRAPSPGRPRVPRGLGAAVLALALAVAVQASAGETATFGPFSFSRFYPGFFYRLDVVFSAPVAAPVITRNDGDPGCPATATAVNDTVRIVWSSACFSAGDTVSFTVQSSAPSLSPVGICWYGPAVAHEYCFPNFSSDFCYRLNVTISKPILSVILTENPPGCSSPALEWGGSMVSVTWPDACVAPAERACLEFNGGYDSESVVRWAWLRPPPPPAPLEPLRPVTRYDPADGRYSRILTAEWASGDTVYLLGGPGANSGKFQDAAGTVPDPQGWLGADLTAHTAWHWQVSDYNGHVTLDPDHSPNYCLWCGQWFEPCGPADPSAGYGDHWEEWLDWYGTVPNVNLGTEVRVQATLNYDCELDYDHLYLEVSRSYEQEVLAAFSGTNLVEGVQTPVDLDVTAVVTPDDYVGPSWDQVRLRFRARSDASVSDEDCGWPGGGHCQIDNIRVSFNGATQTYDDFQTGESLHWTRGYPPAVGNFAAVWARLADVDPCAENRSPQMAFIDNGVVVPGTGGSPGVSWTYGPGGFVVNSTGGLAGGYFHMNNEVWSPSLAWPGGASYDGAQFRFDVYQHLPLRQGMFYLWHLRTSLDGGATWSDWLDRSFVYYSNASDYLRVQNDVTDLLAPGRTHVQLALGVNEYGWVWGLEGADCTPAPYFDNVAFLVHPVTGPAIAARDIDLFQDSFPANGVLDFGNLAANSVRLDMARNISPRSHLRNDPGDSIVVRISVAHAGATLAEAPVLVYTLRENPLFNGCRGKSWPRTGTVPCALIPQGSAKSSAGSLWYVDLPDSHFFYPGDILHFRFEARDNLGGVSRLPSDLTGFGVFPGDFGYVPLRYPSAFIVRALPSMSGNWPGDQPRILFWNDGSGCGGEAEWIGALSQLGFEEGLDYDVYETRGPTSGVGNGLGGRATAATLAGYTTLLYSCGNLGEFTLSNGDFARDPGDDINLLGSWLSQGGKNWLCTGDDVAENLGASGGSAAAFRDTWLSVAHHSGNLRPLIGNQTSPLIKPIAGNALGLTKEYIAYGGCPVVNDFDAVTAAGSAVRVAEFTDPARNPGVYPYAAIVYNYVASNQTDVVFFPYDFMFIHNPGKAGASLPVRAAVLGQLLGQFGEPGSGLVSDVPTPQSTLSAQNRPNPFNPRTEISYQMPRDGELTVEIYNLRGEFVRKLLDEPVKAGRGAVVWTGDDERGLPVAAGVYFCRLKGAGQEVVRKMTMVR